MRAFLHETSARAGAKLRAVRNRRFRTGLRHDPGGPLVVLSPHPDDAVLGCWSVLTGPRAVTVINVFARVPAAGPPGYFERLAGARDAAAHVRARLAEDREALDRAGRSATNLGFAALSHRRWHPEPSFARLDRALAAELDGAACVIAPAALGAAHPDHELVLAYALALGRQGIPVRLYADLPYCAVYGWPAWVTGEQPDPHLDVDAYWRESAGGPVCSPSRAEVVRLGGPQAAAKLAAMRAYRAEFAVLDRGPVGQLSNPAIHAYEVFWSTTNGTG